VWDATFDVEGTPVTFLIRSEDVKLAARVKKNLTTIAVLALLAGLATGTKAAPDIGVPRTVGDLYATCISRSGDPVRLICRSYIQGVVDMMRLSGTFELKMRSPEDANVLLPFAGCEIPEFELVRHAFLHFVEKNAWSRRDEPILAVWQAVQQSWPCPKKGTLPLPPNLPR
jgi:hypothetical protein